MARNGPRPQHTVIVGAGVIGICCAYYLLRRGQRVTVIEAREIAGAASKGNAGSIAPGHEPINRPGQIWQAFKWMFSSTSPLYIASRPDIALARWLWSFHRHCRHEFCDESMRLLGPMGHRSAQLYDEITETENLDCNYQKGGYYSIFRTRKGLDGAKRQAEVIAELGYAPEILSGHAVRDREPALAEDVIGAVRYPESSWCDPQRFVLQLAERVVQLGGVIRDHTPVRALAVEQGRVRGVHTATDTAEADTVLLATGAETPRLLAGTGYRLPLQPAKGYHRQYTGGSGVPKLNLPCVLGEAYVFCTPIGDALRLAGTLEFSGFNLEMRTERLEQLSRAAQAYFREVDLPAPTSQWCGQRPCLPDGLPAIGWVPGFQGLAIATGHAMMGLTLGPVTGELVAQLLLDGATQLDLSLVRPDRF
ncbi:MAG: FAD-dependent oxidoreductase [Nannocystaceae bacterium]